MGDKLWYLNLRYHYDIDVCGITHGLAQYCSNVRVLVLEATEIFASIPYVAARRTTESWHGRPYVNI
jgi:hypothetical protein